MNLARLRIFLSGANGGEKGTDPDPDSSQVVHFVDLQNSVDLVAAGENLIYLICCYGIQTAAEGVQLDQLQVISCLDEVCGGIKPGVVHPLVVYAQRPFDRSKVGDRILGQDGNVVGGNHIRDSMVNLRVNMIRTSGENNAVMMGFLHPFEDFPSLLAYFIADIRHLNPSGVAGLADLLFGNVMEDLYQLVCQGLLRGHGQERIHEVDGRILQLVDVVLDVFGVRGNDRAVVVIYGFREFLTFIGNTWIENILHTLTDQPGDVAVADLGGIAGGITWDGLDAKLIDLPRGSRGQDNAVSELGEEGEPQRIILIHVQNTRDSDFSARSLVRGQRRVAEDAVVFPLVHVRNMVCVFLLSDSSLAAVSADVLAAAGEAVDGQAAVVRAALAVGALCGVLQCVDLVDGKHCGFPAFAAIAGDQGGAEGTHDSGDVRADCFAVRNALKASEHCVVVEGTALYDDVAAKLFRVGDLYYLIKSVPDDGVRESGRDVGDGRALLLCLLHAGVHEYRASCSEVYGVLCEQSLLRKVLDFIAQRIREVLDKRTAAGGAGLVQLDAVDGVIADLDAFHVLTADIQDAVHIRIKEGSGGVVRDGLDFALVQHETGFDQLFSVSGGTGIGNPRAFRKLAVDVLDGTDRGGQRISVIIVVERVQELSVLGDQGRLCRGGAGIDAEITVSLIFLEIAGFDLIAVVALDKFPVFVLIGKQRRHAGNLHLHLDAVAQALLHISQRIFHVFLCIQGRTQSSKKMGIFRNDGVFLIKVQSADEAFAKLGEEVQRTAEEGNMAADRFAAGKTGDGLVYHCLKNRYRQIFLGRALIDQRLNVRLCKDSAACGDRVDRLIVFGVFVQSGRVRLQKRGHLINERAGSSGADAVHSLLDISILKVDDLRVLAAELDGNVSLGSLELQGGGDRDNLLHERNIDVLSQGKAAGPGDDRMNLDVSRYLFRLFEKICEGFLNFSKMSPVVGEQDVLFQVQDDNLDRCGTDINT